jgi:uncharacterized protein (DUF4415 family)
MNKHSRAESVDDDNPGWTVADTARATPITGLPSTLRNKLRGAQKAPLKQSTTIRFDPDVLAALKASGKGWQTRVNEAMREWAKQHGLMH